MSEVGGEGEGLGSGEGHGHGSGKGQFAGHHDVSSGHGGWQTPRSLERSSKKGDRYTPNGTKVPNGTPPPDPVGHDGTACPPPPLPPFPCMAPRDLMGESVLKDFQHLGDGVYEMYHERKGMGDVSWRPTCERSGSPGTAKTRWLEREVESLRGILNRISDGNPTMNSSSYWTRGFQNEGNRGNGDGGASTRAHVHAALGELNGQGRAAPLSNGLGSAPKEFGDGRAATSGSAFSSAQNDLGDGRAATLGGVLGSAHNDLRDGRAATLSSVLGSAHNDLRDGRAATLSSGLAHGEACGPDRASGGMAWGGGLGGVHLPGAGGAQLHDGMGGPSMPAQWSESASGGGVKQDLPELPLDASPIQLGDWLALSSPILRDISAVSSRWWQLTVQQAHGYYDQWRQASPLDRIQNVPQLPQELQESRYLRTEQRGVNLLLKAIPSDQVQMLVTARELNSTSILFRLLVRFQPGGTGEKQLLLNQLTQLEKSTTMAALAVALRSWRRHYSRALEIGASLPDGSLLLRALEPAVQQVAALDTQAAFRLAQARATLAVDERPVQASVFNYSQCLLAEAETLSLTSTTSASTGSTPIKVKQLDGKIPSKATSYPPTNSKGKGDSAANQPCRFFLSDAGCRAGSKCKWRHSWDDLTDGSKGDRCWHCGSKEHRKAACPVIKSPTKSKDGKDTKTKVEASAASGGGSGGSTGNGGGSSMKQLNEVSGTTGSMASGSEVGTSAPTSHSEGSGNDQSAVSGEGGPEGFKGSAELLQEATKLLKSLRTPQIKAIRMSKLEFEDSRDWVLLDSGATHALRPASNVEEWSNAVPTQVCLAEGISEKLRLKSDTKVLLSDPKEVVMSNSWIVPLGGIAELGYRFEWKDGRCLLHDPRGQPIQVEVRHGCPMVKRQVGSDLISQMEHQQTVLLHRMCLVKALLHNPQLKGETWSSEIALTLKVASLFPALPEEILAKIVPDLKSLHASDFNEALPWNRRKRRRLQRARHVILHLFSGPDSRYWEKQMGSSTTEILCIDLQGSPKADILDGKVYAYLLTLASFWKIEGDLGWPTVQNYFSTSISRR